MENSSDEFLMADLAGELNTQLTVSVTKSKPRKKRKLKPRARKRGLGLLRPKELGFVQEIPEPKMFDITVLGEALGLKFYRKITGMTADNVSRFIEESKYHFQNMVSQEYRARKLQLGQRQVDVKVDLK